METMENALEESLSNLTGEPVKIDYFGDRQHRALDKLGQSANRAVDAVMKRNGLRHGVKTDDTGGISLEEVWADPTKIADFYYEQGIKYANSDAGRFVSGATDLVTEAGGKAVNNVNKGGETALRGALDKFGQTTAEVVDLGAAGAGAVGKLADTATDVAKSLEKIGDGVTLAKLPERAPSSVPGGNLRTSTDAVPSINNPELDVVGIPESLRPTRPMRDPLDPVPNPVDDFTANVPGDAQPSRMDLSNAPAETLRTQPQPRAQSNPQAGEKTAELDLEIPPPASSADRTFDNPVPAAREPVNRPAARFDRSRITADVADAAELPASMRPTRRMQDPLEPVTNPADDFTANVPGDAPPSQPDLTNVPAELLQTKRQPRVQPDGPAGEKAAELNSNVPAPAPGTTAADGSYVGLNERLGPEFQRSLDSAGEKTAKLDLEVPAAPRDTARPRQDDPFDADGDGNFGLDDGLTPQPTRPNEVTDVAPSGQGQRVNDGFDPDGTTREMARPRQDDPFDADGDGNFGLNDGVTPQPARPNEVTDVAPSGQGQRVNDGFDPDGTTREMARPRQDDPFDADGDGNFGLNDGVTPQPARPNEVTDVAPSGQGQRVNDGFDPDGTTREMARPRQDDPFGGDLVDLDPDTVPGRSPARALDDASGNLASQPSTQLPTNPDRGADQAGLTERFDQVLESPNGAARTPDGNRPRQDDPFGGDLVELDPNSVPSRIPSGVLDDAVGNLASQPSSQLPTNPDRGADQAGLTERFDQVLESPNGAARTPDGNRPRQEDPFGGDLAALDPDTAPGRIPDGVLDDAASPEPFVTDDKKTLSPDYLADKVEIDGPRPPRELTDIETGQDLASPFNKDLGSIADDIPVLKPGTEGPGYTAVGLGRGSARNAAENAVFEIRTPDGQTKKYRLGKPIGEGGFSTVYQSLDEFGVPDGSVIRLTDVSSDRAGLFRDLTGRELLRSVEGSSPYFSTSAGSGKPDIVRIGRDDIAIAREAEVQPASSKFRMRNNDTTTGLRAPNKLESLTMQLAIRDLNKRGLAWTDHKMQNFALVSDRNSPTGYRMVIFDTGSIIPMKGKNAAGRASNALEVQRHYDRPTDGSTGHLMLVFDSNITGRMDQKPFGQKLDILGGEHRLAVTSNAKNRGRDEYFRLSNMSDAELNAYIGSDLELAQLLKDQGKTVEGVLIK